MSQTALNSSRRWIRPLLISLGVVLTLLLLVVPLVFIFVAAFSAGVGGVWQNLTDPDMLHAIGLTLLVAGLTVPINLIFGTLIAWSSLIAVAGFARVSVLDLVRVLTPPVLIGLAASTVAAVLFF